MHKQINQLNWVQTLIDVGGDLNGDGFADLIFEEYYNGTRVVFGTQIENDVQNQRLVDDLYSSGIYYSVGARFVGDVNGDGFDDVLVTDYENNEYVVFGSSEGASVTSLSEFNQFSNENGFNLDANKLVESGFDFNGDQFDDLSLVDGGNHYVIFGSSDIQARSLEISELNGINGFHLDTEVVNSGDLNGDGYDDLVFEKDDQTIILFGTSSALPMEVNVLEASSLNLGSIDSVFDVFDQNGDGVDDVIFENGLVFRGGGEIDQLSFSSAEIRITIVGENDAPIAVMDRLFICREQISPLTSNLLSNDSDADLSDTLTVNQLNGNMFEGEISETLASGASITVSSDGILSYELNDAFGGLTDTGRGRDVVDYAIIDSQGDTSESQVEVIVVSGAINNGVIDQITEFSDAIFGISGRVNISALGGDDFVDSGSGRDKVFGDGGDDLILGRGGNDILSGGEGSDEIDGGGGRDFIDGGIGNDELIGGDGADVISGGDGADTISGRRGSDTIDAGAGNDVVSGRGLSDVISGGKGMMNCEGMVATTP
ncbi:calcium-binding protein [Parvularcula sp. IMCC14364]|uniref:calcium-binding protein n=1 Tax=Parvularcula sp. IMCC14364 TaxID=3067902 RepID=UPI00274258EB|nr:Ig-like domain-containing protein [Parvularcula sp. IMCC14364]